MTYEIYRYIFIGGAILAGIMLVVSVLVFFLLKIPTVIGDLTGSNARKAIEDIRNQNESTGEKSHRTSHVNRERGKTTDKISPSGRVTKNPSHSLRGGVTTEKISTQKLHNEAPAAETTVLAGQSNETTVLTGQSNETTVLYDQGGAAETTVLGHAGSSSETTVLSAPVAAPGFVIEYEITFIHTNETTV